jgi:hypothetical protein
VFDAAALLVGTKWDHRDDIQVEAILKERVSDRISDLRFAIVTKYQEAARRQSSALRGNPKEAAESIAQRAMRELRSAFRTLPPLLRFFVNEATELEELHQDLYGSLQDLANDHVQAYGMKSEFYRDKLANMAAGLVGLIPE